VTAARRALTPLLFVFGAGRGAGVTYTRMRL